jgi:hydroxymethylpyrimidine pyrophosphatase-like HAD family hydrolase
MKYNKLVFDLDDTIIFCDYDNAKYHLKSCDKFLIKTINKYFELGTEIVIHTGRHWNNLQHTLNQLERIGLKYHTLIMGKPPADLYIDDKAMTPGEFMRREKL